MSVLFSKINEEIIQLRAKHIELENRSRSEWWSPEIVEGYFDIGVKIYNLSRIQAGRIITLSEFKKEFFLTEKQAQVYLDEIKQNYPEAIILTSI